MELVTKNQYMKRFNIGYPKLLEMIAKKEVDYLPIADRIRIDENTVSIELYNAEVKRRIIAEEKLNAILDLTSSWKKGDDLNDKRNKRRNKIYN